MIDIDFKSFMPIPDHEKFDENWSWLYDNRFFLYEKFSNQYQEAVDKISITGEYCFNPRRGKESHTRYTWESYLKILQQNEFLFYKYSNDLRVIRNLVHWCWFFGSIDPNSEITKEDFKGFFRDTCRVLLVLEKYLDCGCRNFYIYTDLLSLLKQTDIPHIQCSDFKLPFDAISMYCEKPLIKVGNDLYERITIYKYEEWIGTVLFSNNQKLIRSFETRLLGDYFLDLFFKEIIRQTEAHEIPSGELAIESQKILFSAICYINSQNADIIEDKSEQEKVISEIKQLGTNNETRRAKELKQKLREAKSKYIYIVGKNIRTNIPENILSDRKLTKRFMVRGHFREQPYGPELSKRKTIWISPFWKGPEFAEIINNQYIVKQRESNGEQ